jgi:penicillin-binding protein 1C
MVLTRIRRLAKSRRLWIAVATLIAIVLWLRLGPLPDGLLDVDHQPSVVIVDRHGERLYEARSAAGTRSDPIDAAALPPLLTHATMGAEDVRFRSHVGLDPIAIVRAFVHDVRALRIVQGGSTITQQVAKLLLARQARRDGAPTRSRGWSAKIREAIVALRLEHRLTKDQILALYLNLAPYGNQIEGAARASQAYFGRAASTLTPAEAAFLAALPQQPTKYNPWRDPSGARRRQLAVLRSMQARGWLSKQDADHARTERLRFNSDPGTLVAPHFVERVLAQLGSSRPRRVETTLDAALQRTVAGIIAAHRPALDDHHASSIAVVVLDNRRSEWIVWEGSGNYFDQTHGGAIDGVVTPRQPGSALKPFTYAAAFERGVSPGRVLADVPSQFPTAQPGILYSPRNYDGQYRGPLLARAALAGSENVPAVALASEVGVPAIARLLRDAGFTTLDNNAAHYGLGLTLGNAEVRLDEIVAGYAMLARGGEFIRPALIRTTDAGPMPSAPSTRLVSPRTAFWITDILSDADARAYIFGRGGSLEFPFTVAAKTGTSQAYHDNWAIGYTSDVSVGVWVGNFDRTPLRNSSGVTGAGPIFHDVMMAAVEHARGSLPIGHDAPIIAPTSDVRHLELCATSGMTATAACPTRTSEWVPAEDEDAACTWHHATDSGLITIWPDVFRPWARAAGLLVDLPPSVVGAGFSRPVASVQAASDLTIVQPLGGAVYLLDPTLRPEFQALPLRARGGRGTLKWFVNGVAIGSVSSDDTVRWPLARGTHAVIVRDDAGRSAETRIVVR